MLLRDIRQLPTYGSKMQARRRKRDAGAGVGQLRRKLCDAAHPVLVRSLGSPLLCWTGRTSACVLSTLPRYSASVACRLIPSMPLCVHPGLPWSSWARRRRPRSCTSPETLLRRGRRLPAARARRCDVYARPPSPRIQVSCARLHSVCFGDCTGVAPTIRKLCAAHIFRGFSVECMLQAERQILDIVNWDWASLKKQLPSAKVLGSLGNHNSGPSSCARRARPRHPPHKSTSMPMMSRGAVVLGCPCLC